MNPEALYAPVALSLVTSLRAHGLSWAERGVLHYVYLFAAASKDRQTAEISRLPGEVAYASWKRTLGEDGAAAVGRLISLGLLEEAPTGLRAVLQSPLAEAFAERRSAPAKAHDEGASLEPPARHRGDTQRALNALRVMFTRHGFKTAEQKRQWLATAAGAAYLEKRGLTVADAETVVAKTGTNGGQFGARTALTDGDYTPPSDGDYTARTKLPPTVITSVITHPSPPHPPSEKDKENQRDPARGAALTDGDYTRQLQDSSRGDYPITDAAITGAFDPLATLQDRAASVADLVGGGELELSLGAMLVRHRVTPAEVDAMVRALATPAVWWPQGASRAPTRVTAATLAGFHTAEGYEFKPLSALIAHVRAGAKKAAHPAPEPPPKAAPLDDATRTRIRAEMASLRSREEPV